MARLLTLMLLCSALTGCELIADFDRSKIPDDRPRPDGGADTPGEAGAGGGGDVDDDAGSDDDAG